MWLIFFLEDLGKQPLKHHRLSQGVSIHTVGGGGSTAQPGSSHAARRLSHTQPGDYHVASPLPSTPAVAQLSAIGPKGNKQYLGV